MVLNKSNANINFKDAVCFITFPNFEKYAFIRHAFSTRLGGVSENEFSSMNFSFIKDSKESVLKNYKIFSKAVGFDPKSLVASRQTHDDIIETVTKRHRGFGIYKESDIKSADGLVTNETGVTLVTFHADCTPIFFLDPVKRVVGLAHSGWRSTEKEIAKKMIEKMVQEFSSKREDILCAIGPAIEDCCYEVDDVVFDKFSKEHSDCFKKKSAGKYMFSLKKINKKMLQSSGVMPENIFVSNLCTKCCSDMFFSHRAFGAKRGTMASMIATV